MPDAPPEQAVATVAVVEDDEGIRSALARLVRTIGYRPCAYAAGEELLLDMEEVGPACVLTDIQMPGMNGLTLVKLLLQRRPGLPILVMTAYPSMTNRQQALAAGAMEYMTKPLDDERLEHWLLEVIGRPGRT